MEMLIWTPHSKFKMSVAHAESSCIILACSCVFYHAHWNMNLTENVFYINYAAISHAQNMSIEAKHRKPYFALRFVTDRELRAVLRYSAVLLPI